MPFGLTSALAVFHNLVDDVLQDILDQFVFVYLDDEQTHSACEPGFATSPRPSALH